MAAMMLTATVAVAAVTLNSDGTGFVGKGDVQLAYGFNNKQLQDNEGKFQFRVNSVEETTWLCRHNTNVNAADQERSVTTTTQGLVSSTERVKNQITGFNLLGYSGTPNVTTDGSALHSCGANRTYIEGSDETTPVSGGLQVSINGTNWITL